MKLATKSSSATSIDILSNVTNRITHPPLSLSWMMSYVDDPIILILPFLPPPPLWGRFLGLDVVFLCELLPDLEGFFVLTAVEVGPSRPLQKSSVQMQAMISSFSTGLGTHCALGTMGRVTLMGERIVTFKPTRKI